jgi:hypothetical protein
LIHTSKQRKKFIKTPREQRKQRTCFDLNFNVFYLFEFELERNEEDFTEQFLFHQNLNLFSTVEIIHDKIECEDNFL